MSAGHSNPVASTSGLLCIPSACGLQPRRVVLCAPHAPEHKESTATPGDLAGDLTTLPPKEPYNLKPVLDVIAESIQHALGGGTTGAVAAFAQVIGLMWMNTVMNYQYRYGMSIPSAAKNLFRQGGIRRFYRGISVALVQRPLLVFGDTAANAGAVALFEASDVDHHIPLVARTMLGSVAASAWRVLLTPFDTIQTSLQVHGNITGIRHRFMREGVGFFYSGAAAIGTASMLGHYPWFLTYNSLSEYLPTAQKIQQRIRGTVSLDDRLVEVLRNGFIGFCSSVASDTVSNAARVVKTTAQTSTKQLTYLQNIRCILEKDGWRGLFGRGLKTRYLINGCQGMLFVVVWRYLQNPHAYD